jgi:hypothetical protein
MPKIGVSNNKSITADATKRLKASGSGDAGMRQSCLNPEKA